MADQPIKLPGPGHPITIELNPRRVVVTAGGLTIADSRKALTLQEADYPPVAYLPRDDVDMATLISTHHHTYCPYKGDAHYFSIASAGERGVNAVWSYGKPHGAVAAIKDHLAFYPNRVDSIEECD